ncbi:TetR/AcrR family transcriptional regulator [Antrihabitans cavernicola]|uniref:TetR/AcrR family transcriptional regulator n=2 Tax=Antrihabitans cavernicola TaxID=2495913 RepID=A0A5A7SGR0_9NOCA|nr:TetR/AcrR family transcriptional regulator [Spelaeibacter cavernicola]
MNAADRRELILAAASRAFARGGYAGTSTDAVAKEASISQPYVVRMFGTKAELFREVFARAIGAITAAFDRVLDDVVVDPEDEEFWDKLGSAYGHLVEDRDLLLVMMHGFSAGSVPEIGAQARDGMSGIYRHLRERTGCTPEQAREFIAHGMLINVLLSMQAPEHVGENPDLEELSSCVLGTVLDDATRSGAN